MKTKLLIALLAPVILFGCATTADVANIQAQIKPIKADIRELFKETTKAKYAAMRADRRAERALVASQNAVKQAQILADNVNSHIGK